MTRYQKEMHISEGWYFLVDSLFGATAVGHKCSTRDNFYCVTNKAKGSCNGCSVKFPDNLLLQMELIK